MQKLLPHLKNLYQFLRRRPWTTLFVVLLLAVIGTLVGLQRWAMSHYRQALKAAEEERYKDGISHLNNCLDLFGWQTADTYYWAARLERLDGNIHRANAFLGLCVGLEKNPSERTKLEIALLQAEMQFSPEVEKVLWTFVKDNEKKQPRETAQALRTLAKVYLNHGELEPAMAAINKWIQLNPNSGEAIGWRGMIEERLDVLDVALNDYRYSVKIAPHNSAIRFQLVNLLLRNYNAREALGHVEILLKEEPNNPEYIAALGNCRLIQGDVEKAHELLVQAHLFHSKNALVKESKNTASKSAAIMGSLAKLEYQTGHFDQAEDWARQAVAADPYKPLYHFLLYESLNRQENEEKKKEAKAQLKVYQDLGKDVARLSKLLLEDLSQAGPDVYSEIGQLYIRTGQEQAGVLWLERALDKDAKHKASHEILADYYQKKKQPEKAAKHRSLANGS